MSSDTSKRIEKVEVIEKDIASALESAGLVVGELAKDAPSQAFYEQHTKNFLHLVQNIEIGLSEQISYLGRVSSSTVCGNTPRLAEQKSSHGQACLRQAQQSLEERLAAVQGKVAKFDCDSVDMSALTTSHPVNGSGKLEGTPM